MDEGSYFKLLEGSSSIGIISDYALFSCELDRAWQGQEEDHIAALLRSSRPFSQKLDLLQIYKPSALELTYPREPYGNALITDMVIEDNIDAIRLLKCIGSSVDMRSIYGRPLYIASNLGRTQMAMQLLAADTNKESAERNGITALMKAAHAGHAKVVDLLLEAGANPNAEASDGACPLHYAAVPGHLEVTRLLLKAGALKDKLTNVGYSPLSMAACNGQSQYC